MPNHEANYSGQNAALEYLKSAIPGVHIPTASDKAKILSILGISSAFKQTFDALRLYVSTIEDVKTAQDFDLLEVKATQKYLPSLPAGFFFGLTENEEMLLKVFDGKYFLCLVSLNEKSRKHALVNWSELKRLTQHKRVQYQINLFRKSIPDASAE